MKRRVLHVNIDNNGGNGAFSLVRNLYFILNNEFFFDFFTMDHFIKNKDYTYIRNHGGCCYSANLREKRLIGHIKLPFIFFKFLKSNNYEIVHVHSEVAYKQALYCIPAKIAGVNKIIVHSHSCDIDGDKKNIKYLMHILFKFIVNLIATDYLACSLEAAEWMFSKKYIKDNTVKIIENGINPSDYKYSYSKRKIIREELNIDNKFVIGHVGALKRVKNQSRLLQILKNSKTNSNVMLLLIGDGEDKSKLVSMTENLELSNYVKFLGSRDDIANLLQAIDVFVFPSLFEGVPLSLIEAQAAGIPILMSDNINDNIIVNNNVYKESLKSSDATWMEKILDISKHHIKETGYYNIVNSKYNIENTSCILKKVYCDE